MNRRIKKEKGVEQSIQEKMASFKSVQNDLYETINKGMSSSNPATIVQAANAWKSIAPKDQTANKAYFVDPMAFAASTGYKTGISTVAYSMLRRMGRVPLIASIIGTRIEQIAPFSEPQVDKYSPGFIVRKKVSRGDEGIGSSSKDDAEARRLMDFISRCGSVENTWHGDDFETFLRKVVKDSLELDQMVFEIVHNRRGEPVEFIAADAATFRISDIYTDPEGIVHNSAGWPAIKGYYPSHVQIYQEQVKTPFYPWELNFGVRNPQTALNSFGYGCSELEILIQTVTSILWSEEYNRAFFSRGSAPKGILRVKGDFDNNSLEAFRQQWTNTVAGVNNAWKTPIMESDSIEWIDLQKTNRDMEFSKYQEWLIKLSCAVFKIDPSEIGFPMSGSAESQPLFDGNNEARLEYSKDKGLRPMLRFLEKGINKSIVERLNPAYEFKFVGLSAESIEAELASDIKKMSNFMTINEIRQSRGLAPLEGGDIIANSSFIGVMEQKLQREQQQQSLALQQQQLDQSQPLVVEEEGDIDEDEEDNPFTKGLFNMLTQ